MATIWDNKNHKSGEKFTLSPGANISIKKEFNKYTYPFEKIDFEDYVKSRSKKVIDFSDSTKKRLASFYFKDSKGEFVKCIIQESANSNFVWQGGSGKANTKKTTQLKEVCSLIAIMNDITSCAQMLQIMSEKFPAVYKIQEELFQEIYYTSAIEHARVFKKSVSFNSSLYEGELQQAQFSKSIYSVAKAFNKKSADNWNPSDIWFIKKTFKTELTSFLRTVKDELAFKEFLNINLYNGNLLGVSLKQVDKNKTAHFDIISFTNIKENCNNFDFTVESCFLREPRTGLPAYGVLETKSGFEIKWGGRADGNKANMNVEGHMKGKNYQLGAIDAKELVQMFNAKKITLFTDSMFTEKNIVQYLEDTLTKLKKLDATLYKKIITDKINKFAKTEDVLSIFGYIECKRFVSACAFFEFFKSLNKDEIQTMFLLAKKVSPYNPDYMMLS